MPSPTELHFEGRTTSVATRRWILLAAIVVIALLAMFAKATLPGQRQELVGRWQSVKQPDSYYEFRTDGTYTAVLYEEWIGGSVQPRGKYEGRWKAAPDALYLSHSKIETIGNKNYKKKYDPVAKERIGKEIKIPIQWTSDDHWTMPYVNNGNYRRVFSRPTK